MQSLKISSESKLQIISTFAFRIHSRKRDIVEKTFTKLSETDNGYNLVRTASFGNLLRDAYDLMPDRDVSSNDEESESGDSVLAQGR